jgi:hypothetical protein
MAVSHDWIRMVEGVYFPVLKHLEIEKPFLRPKLCWNLSSSTFAHILETLLQASNKTRKRTCHGLKLFRGAFSPVAVVTIIN